MDGETLLFLKRHMDALPLYKSLDNRILKEIEDVRIQVQKSQISFTDMHLFACVSFMRVRKQKEHHPVVEMTEEIDDELMDWIKEAAGLTAS